MMKKLLTYLLCATMAVGLFAPLAAQAQVNANNIQSGGSVTVTPGATQAVTTNSAQAQVNANTNNIQSGGGVTVTPGATQAVTTASSVTGTNSQNNQDDIGCSVAAVTGSTSVTPGMGVAICISSLVYYTMVGLGSWFANITAYLFDYSVYISLNSAAYALDFIALGWGIVRDVVNMAFLFILVYIGFKVIFAAETAGTIRLLVGVIVVALLVNFSFLMTRLVVDAGNIVAVQFYNAIAAGSTGTVPGWGTAIGGVPVRDITSTIMNALNPQALIGSSNTGVSSFKSFVSNPSNSAMYYLIVSSIIYILTGVTLFMLGATFIFLSLKFILRVVGLWFVIIGAPAAFIAGIFRIGKGGGGKLFDLWLGYLIKFSFYPAVFLFMFYIQVRFMLEMNTAQLFNNVLNSTSAANASWTNIASAAANVSVRLGFIMTTMYLSLMVADWAVGEGSRGAAKFVRDSVTNYLPTGLRWSGRGLGYGFATAAQPVRRGIQSQANAATSTGVNATLWRGINRAVGGTNTATPRQFTRAGILDSFRRQPGVQQTQVGQQGAAEQNQQAQQVQANARQQTRQAQPAHIEPRLPDYTGTAPEPRVVLPGSRAAENLPPGVRRIEPRLSTGNTDLNVVPGRLVQPVISGKLSSVLRAAAVAGSLSINEPTPAKPAVPAQVVSGAQPTAATPTAAAALALASAATPPATQTPTAVATATPAAAPAAVAAATPAPANAVPTTVATAPSAAPAASAPATPATVSAAPAPNAPVPAAVVNVTPPPAVSATVPTVPAPATATPPAPAAGAGGGNNTNTADLSNVGKILESLKNAQVQKDQPFFNKSAEPVLMPKAERIGGEPLLTQEFKDAMRREIRKGFRDYGRSTTTNTTVMQNVVNNLANDDKKPPPAAPAAAARPTIPPPPDAKAA